MWYSNNSTPWPIGGALHLATLLFDWSTCWDGSLYIHCSKNHNINNNNNHARLIDVSVFSRNVLRCKLEVATHELRWRWELLVGKHVSSQPGERPARLLPQSAVLKCWTLELLRDSPPLLQLTRNLATAALIQSVATSTLNVLIFLLCCSLVCGTVVEEEVATG